MKNINDILRQIPAVDLLLKAPQYITLAEQYSAKQVSLALRTILADLRKEIIASKSDDWSNLSLLIHARVELWLQKYNQKSLKAAVNATGIILHTGLGRALLPEDAVANINTVAAGYSSLAVNPITGKRLHRDEHLKDMICALTGAEDATVVNNNAAATMLILNTLAQGKEVIVSRGQLVEIGGAFRMPDVMKQSGAILHEIGTTNKVHMHDYEDAINENTGAILHVHMSNYRIQGFFSEPSIEELTVLGQKYNIPVIDDIGSGALVDLSKYGLEKEPLVQDSVASGADLTCFSGDKLIGGPQAGIIVGKSSMIAKVRKNQLARALRIGKLTIAGLEATLALFREPEKLEECHPFYKMLSCPTEKLKIRADYIVSELQANDKIVVEAIKGFSQVGSGSVPAEVIDSWLVQIKTKALPIDSFARDLRKLEPGIFARIQNDAVLLDLRTIQAEFDDIIVNLISTNFKND